MTLPAQLGRYQVLEPIGQGAMGAVYKARDPVLDRTVAIKTLGHALLAFPEHRDEVLEIADPEMSRSHAALGCQGLRIVLRDLGSRNGTWVGDEKIAAREIEHRSEFRLGGTRLMLIVADAD